MVFHPNARFPQSSGPEHAGAPSANVRHPMPAVGADEGGTGTQYNRGSNGGGMMGRDFSRGGMRDQGGFMPQPQIEADGPFNPNVRLDTSRFEDRTGDVANDPYAPAPRPNQAPLNPDAGYGVEVPGAYPGAGALNEQLEGEPAGYVDNEAAEDPQANLLGALAQLLGGGQQAPQQGGFDLSQVLGQQAPMQQAPGAGAAGRQQALQRMIQGR